MKQLLSCLILFIASSAIIAQTDTVLVHIKLIDGRTGLPMTNQIDSRTGLPMANPMIGLEEETQGYPHKYRDISSRANASGVATIMINRNSVILTHNTHGYVDCGDEHGGLIHNDYKVRDIVSAGIVEPIVQSNLCTKTSGSAKPGELILFVRPWMPGEDM